MIIHLTGLFFSVIFGRYSCKCIQNKYKYIFASLSALPFILISGFRYYVGTDFRMYKNIFEAICRGRVISTILVEPGYIFLNKIVARVTHNYVVFFMFMAVITIGCYFLSIYMLSCNPVQSIFFWFISCCFFMSFNAVRQMLSVALFCIGIFCLYKKKWIIYFILFIIAYFIHRSALIFLPVFLIYQLKFNIRRSIEFAGVAVIVSFFASRIVGSFSFLEKYIQYFNLARSTDFRFSDLVIMSFVWCSALYFQQFIQEDDKYAGLMKIQYCGVVVCAVSGMIPMAARILMYFQYTPVFLIPEILRVCKNRKNKIIYTSCIAALYIAQWAYFAFVVGYKDFFYYTSVFGK